MLIVTELCLGGGGRFTAWGIVSLRMILFSLAIILTSLALFNQKKREMIRKEYLNLLLLFILVVLIGLVTGIENGTITVFWKEDIKPLAYFLILPFFLITICSKHDVSIISNIIIISSAIISVLFFLALLVIHLQLVPFLSFYQTVANTEELFFRGEYTFFYKGFLYVGIGIIFIYFLMQGPFKRMMIILLSLVLLLSLTRGMMLAVLLTLALYYLYEKPSWRITLPVFLSVFILFEGRTAITKISLWLDANKSIITLHDLTMKRPANILLGDRVYSDSQRLIQFKEVYDRTSLSSILIGHGFGIGVPDRPIHMEISYLEIFHKQGIIGLAFWSFLLWMLWSRYKVVSDSPYAKSFFYGSLFVFIQSFTNQYINNPIGLSMLLLSLVCLDRLKKEII